MSRQKKKKLATQTQCNSPIPDKLYFNISEVSELCSIKAYVLRYWEQEFSQLKPNKHRGNRRYYQREDILLIRMIKSLLYEEGFTIEGARAKLAQSSHSEQENSIQNAQQPHLIKKMIAELEMVLQNLQSDIQ